MQRGRAPLLIAACHAVRRSRLGRRGYGQRQPGGGLSQEEERGLLGGALKAAHLATRVRGVREPRLPIRLKVNGEELPVLAHRALPWPLAAD